jgi:hypothetical protein
VSLNEQYKPFLLEKSVTSKAGVVTWERIQGAWTGFIQPTSSTANIQQGKGGELSQNRMYCPLNIPFLYGYRVTQDGVQYKMLYGANPKGVSGTGDHKEIYMSYFA